MSGFVVVFDDEGGLVVPMTWDEECEGALCGTSAGTIALFSTRKEARDAITISARFAALQQAQGKAFSEDFTPKFRKNIHIRPCGTKGSK